MNSAQRPQSWTVKPGPGTKIGRSDAEANRLLIKKGGQAVESFVGPLGALQFKAKKDLTFAIKALTFAQMFN